MKGLLILMMVLASASAWAQTDLKVGTTPGSITSSAVFEAASTSKGLLIPRMTTAQMNAIVSPTLGLMVFNTDLNCLHFYFSGWKSQCDPANLGAWSILGNNNIVDGTNFLGTTTSVPLSFRVNNQPSGRIDNSAMQTTFFGYRSGLNTISPATNNSAFGFQALMANTTGVSNTAMGSFALNASITGQANTVIGYNALRNATASSYNIAIGENVMSAATGGDYNTVVGNSALQNNTTGINNTAIGLFTLQSNTTGQYNVAIGSHTLIGNTSGNHNIAMGHYAMQNNTTGTLNVAIGPSSLANAVAGTNNIAIGEGALRDNAGNYNISMGQFAMYRNTSGSDNIGIGRTALNYNTTGGNNIGLGFAAVYANTTGSNNIGIGYNALNANITASGNTVLGVGAAQYTTGGSNVALGYNALNLNTSGTNNIALGYNAGSTNTTGSNNTILGYNANVSSVALSNATAIGANATVGASNSLVLGGIGANAVAVGINTTTPQYKLDVDGMTGSAGNPLRLQGLNIGANTDSMVTTLNGVVRQIPVSLLTTRLRNDFWAKIGNGGTDPNNEFVGTTDNVGLAVRTNNTERMRINEVGNVGVNTTTPNSTVQVNGSFSTALTTKTAAYTATNADHIIISNATTAAFTLTLPTAVGITGRQYIIKKTDASVNAVTVATTGGQTIDGAATVTISIQWQTKTFVSDGTNWLIISNQ